jgi:hypothetical protein
MATTPRAIPIATTPSEIRLCNHSRLDGLLGVSTRGILRVVARVIIRMHTVR